MRKMVLVSLATIVLLAVSNNAQARCGKERWLVKTGTDADAHLVNMAVHLPTSVEDMRNWPKPDQIPNNKRIAPYELQVWQVDAMLVDYKFENSKRTGDSDYHLVLKGESGKTMIAEIPSPACVDDNSPFRAAIRNARAEFDAKLHATGRFKNPKIPVTVVGVGFFDIIHGQKGVAHNGIELHPVLSITFNQ